MFTFDDYENLNNYTFTYPAEEVLKSEYEKWVRKQSKSSVEYQEFVISFVKERIAFGSRKHKETEPEWESLSYYIAETEKEFDANKDIAVKKATILYDQVLLLFCEGYPLPPNML